MVTSVNSARQTIIFSLKFWLPAIEKKLPIHRECGWITCYSMHMMARFGMLPLHVIRDAAPFASDPLGEDF